MGRLWSFCVLFVTVSCVPLPPIPFVADADFAPPVVVGMQLADAVHLEVEFDEPVRLVEGPRGSSEISVAAASVDTTRLLIRMEAAPSPERVHHVEAQVADESGNHLRFVARFHGLNALLPAMLINEFTTQGSGRNPDLVEILILTDGNLAGAVLFEGTPESWEQRFVFPSVDVRAGDFVVVHFKPQGVPDEVTERLRADESGGYNASGAWDFWVEGGTGLSSNNGVLSLSENANGGYLDAVLYSNRTSASDEPYRGFGSRAVMERADALQAAGQWIASGQAIAPEDAINPDPSTGTRSMARGSDPSDRNSGSDWHVTPTRGLSPGAPNTDEVHGP